MKSVEDAMVLSKNEGDSFYVRAFFIEAWLGELTLEAAAEYAEKKQAKDRAMQTGQAWRGFLELFGHARDDEIDRLLNSLFRFADYEHILSQILLQASIPLATENDCYGDFIGPNILNVPMESEKLVALMRRSIERWCDWIDSAIHCYTHVHYHVQPESFDFDPEKRELIALGGLQRDFPKLDHLVKAQWEYYHREAAERFKDSPKWTAVGKLMSIPLRIDVIPADVDRIVILLWPLMKRHNWTYRDLMRIIRGLLPPPSRYPLGCEQDLAAHCSNVLGLRKQNGPAGKSSPDGKPPGYEVAIRLCRRESPSGSS